MVNQVKQLAGTERRDIIVRRFDIVLWRQARIAAMEKGETMAAWLETIVRKAVKR